MGEGVWAEDLIVTCQGGAKVCLCLLEKGKRFPGFTGLLQIGALFPIQSRPNFFGKTFSGKRLLDKIHPFIQYAVARNHIGGISGHEQAFEIRI